MKTIKISMLALGLCVLIMGGCTPRKMTSSEFYVFCWTADNSDSCDADLAICGRFRADLDKQFKSADECLEQCANTYNDIWREYSFDKCYPMTISSRSLCDQYCRRNFSGGADNQTPVK